MKKGFAGSLTGAVCAALIALIAATPSRAQSPDPSPDRVHDYVSSLVGPAALVSIGATAAYDQLRDSPQQWDSHFDGFGTRLISATGARVANQTVRHGFAAVLDRTTAYERCTCTSFGARLGHAIAGAVTDRNAAGHTKLSEPALAGAVAGAYAPLMWRPEYTASDAARGIGFSLGLSALGNMLYEFILH